MTQSRAKPIAMPRSARLPPTYIGFRVHVNMPVVATASVGCDGRVWVPMRRKMRLAPITIPRPATKAMAPTTIRPRNKTWVSSRRGLNKLRTIPATRTESGISGGKITTLGVSWEESVMESFVALGSLGPYLSGNRHEKSNPLQRLRRNIRHHFLCPHAGQNQAPYPGRAARRLQFGTFRSHEL
jgi:hypothetical protein